LNENGLVVTLNLSLFYIDDQIESWIGTPLAVLHPMKRFSFLISLATDVTFLGFSVTPMLGQIQLAVSQQIQVSPGNILYHAAAAPTMYNINEHSTLISVKSSCSSFIVGAKVEKRKKN
jgi:hypothetical protein